MKLKKPAAVAPVLVLAIGGWILLTSNKAPSDPNKATEYWFERYLRLTNQTEPSKHARIEQATQHLRALGTNALPYLLQQAFSGQARVRTLPELQRCADVIARFGINIRLPANLSPEQVRSTATALICECRPPSYVVLHSVAAPLTGTNFIATQRAIHILGCVGNGDPRVIQMLLQPTKGYSVAQSDISAALKSYLENADGAFPAFLSWVTAQDWAAESKDWIAIIAWILQTSGPKAKAAAPGLLRWLSLQDPNGPYTMTITWETGPAPNRPPIQFRRVVSDAYSDTVVVDSRYFSAVTALATIAPDLPDTRRYLEDAFTLATNSDARLTLAAALLQVDAHHPEALTFMTNAWVTELSAQRWYQASNALASVQFDLRQLPEPLRLRPAPLSQWLALGQGVGPSTLGPTLSDWWTLLGTNEPEFKGQPLKKWLLLPDPDWLYSAHAEPFTEILEQATKTLRASRTNCIPWFLKWLQTPSDENVLLVRRAFRLLGPQSLVALPALVELAQSEKPETRAAAYRCITRIAPEWEILWPALIPALHHNDAAVRLEAARFVSERFPDQARQSGVYDCLPLAFRQANSPDRRMMRYSN